jgi:outer membrane protein OmpA-like peptidoglycan-associated protein
MKKLLLSAVAALTLVTSASAWDFCSDESQIGVAATGMGAGVAAMSSAAGGVPGLIVGAILNQWLCDPVVSAAADAETPKTLVDAPLKTNDVPGAKTVYFDFDKYELNAAGKEATTVTADAVKKIANTPIRIEGNADSRGSDEYNYALGLKRANAVKDRLVAEGVTNKLEVVSNGEAKPACEDATEDCFGKNRRVEFKTAE